MTNKNSLSRLTNALCPHCKKGYIVDERGTLPTKEMPKWVCNQNLKVCNYRNKFGKDWQWASWDWEVPYFIMIDEDNEEKNSRLDYESNIKNSSKFYKRENEAERKISENLKICRTCGKRNCIRINNCL